MLLSYKPLHLEAQQRLQEEGCVVDIKGVMQRSSVSISLSFENQGINPVGGSSKVPRTYTNKLRTRNQRNKGVVNPFTATCKSDI